MRKRTILFILISLALVFGLVGTAAADAPEAVECWIPWWDSNDETYWFPVEGQLVHTGQGFNLSCPYFIDFSDPMNASIEHVCQDILGPGGCSGGNKTVVIQNTYYGFWYNGEFYWLSDNFFHLTANGTGRLFAQYAPDQCQSEQRGFSWTLEFPAGYWAPGEHTIDIYWYDDYGWYEANSYNFWVEEGATLLHSQVRFGMHGPYPTDTIHPDQDTFFQVSLSDQSFNLEWVQFIHDTDHMTVSWDGGEYVEIQPGPITPVCSPYNPALLVRTYGYGK